MECVSDLGVGDFAKVIKWRRKLDGSGLRKSGYVFWILVGGKENRGGCFNFEDVECGWFSDI